ncbi:peptidase S10 serine carboxypeptidase [Desulfatibacillum aliphaticivorans]|uniref:Peptidase S10 serine carboxypeptidase n=1 Tax=Desulfatibacillum aliphaticivorans TaxID=218208 RepID=B8FAZ9_DESAL|nr:peptidase S10 [Desulfatibacillum aliphaticivorans]ACL04085.1 peptidase S10 serine carboxypeptidase [Desulfatibacillum aliphaticivorans]
MKKISWVILLLLFLCFLLTGACDLVDDDGHLTPEGVDLISRAGFIKIPSITYSLHHDWFNGVQTSPAHIFYSFQAADVENPEEYPVFVFFNGGPGAATTGNLLSMNTTDRTLSKLVTGDDPDAANPFSWRKIGNLLYIDAPGTGFSYTQGAGGDICDDLGQRMEDYYHGVNFNPYIDADMMVRAMLEALRINDVQAGKVVLVGESYGGVRTSLMLNMLLFYNDYSGPSERVFWDNELPDVVRAHLNAINGSLGQDFSPAQIAEMQFGKHVMIQPQLTGWRQTYLTGMMLEEDGSVIDQLADQYGKPRYVRCAESNAITCYIPFMGGPYLTVLDYVSNTLELDGYNFQEPIGWTDSFEEHTTNSLYNLKVLKRLLNYDPELITGMYAEYRQDNNAYKYLNAPTPIPEFVDDNLDLVPAYAKAIAMVKNPVNNIGANDLEDAFGILKGCDAYVKTWDEEQCYAYYMNDAWINLFFQFFGDWSKIGKYRIDPEADEYGRLFLYNLAVADVMITNAAYDFMVYSPSVPPSFEGYDEVNRVEADAQHEAFTIYYQDSTLRQDLPETSSRTIYHPAYDSSGHAVSITQPEKLRRDVANFVYRR